MSKMINPFGFTKTEIAIFEMGETSGWSRGVKAEQQRIIKLLEEQKKIFSKSAYSTTGGYAERFALNQAIAVIKGDY